MATIPATCACFIGGGADAGGEGDGESDGDGGTGFVGGGGATGLLRGPSVCELLIVVTTAEGLVAENLMKEEDEDGDEDAEVEDAVEQHGDGEFAILMHVIDVATDMSGRLKNLKSGFCLVKMTRGRRSGCGLSLLSA